MKGPHVWTILGTQIDELEKVRQEVPVKKTSEFGVCHFSRMRSEGFPFIVGVWGWTCVRVVFVVSSSCRRVVVGGSSCRRRGVVNSLPCGRASGGVLEDFLCM